MALGIVMVGGGTGEALAGGAICITGVGCLAGAPAIAMSAGLIVAGAYSITEGVTRFDKGLGTALREARARQGASQEVATGSVKAPSTLDAFPGAQRAKPKMPVQGGGGLRKRWKDNKGTIYEWDSQHGTVEKYNKRGKHQGEYDPKTGAQTKPADPKREVEP
ncbi:colicin E3/pyocin S6 family cytotoxin [Streptomyces sp. DH8]|uniref:colicin E3/pyocin S6 family cytotoxin n=1 Tax=Streptomyces sp. DH8 TaxID=2857008 RepID=UPI001E28FBD8|nr:colicin E3/pyocin S6 family cytotoxin [Streptomyces sp. DH8]